MVPIEEGYGKLQLNGLVRGKDSGNKEWWEEESQGVNDGKGEATVSVWDCKPGCELISLNTGPSWAAGEPRRRRSFFFFFSCGWSAVLRPSVHMLPGTRWCGTGLLPFPTVCWWLTHPAAVTGVSVSARWRTWWTISSASLQSQSAESMMPIRFRCARRPQCPVRNLNIVVRSCLARWLIWSEEGL